MEQEYRKLGAFDHGLRDAAEDQLARPAPPIAAHYHEIGAMTAGHIGQLLLDRPPITGQELGFRRDAVPASPRILFRPRHATHGATMLRRDVNPRGGAENWAAVLEFLGLLPDEPPA